jgi:segregation and condensation protein A
MGGIKVTDIDLIVLKLDNFEGPLDLLLELISKKKLKISEVRISQLIDDYLDILEQAKGENLEIKADFIVVASELLEIKAKAIITQNTVTEEEKAWRHKLEEYAVFREISEKIKHMENEYNISYSRTGGRKILSKPMREYKIGELQPLDLFRSYAVHLEQQKEEEINIILESSYSVEEVAKVLYEAIQIRSRTYDWIFDRAEDKMHLIYLFLSVLELYKDGYILLDITNVASTGKIWTNLAIQKEYEEHHV